MRPRIWRAGILATGFLLVMGSATALGGAPDARPPSKPDCRFVAAPAASAFDVNDCKTCHEKQLTIFEHTRHMKVPGHLRELSRRRRHALPSSRRRRARRGRSSL